MICHDLLSHFKDTLTLEHNCEALLGILCSFLSELLPLPGWSQALGSRRESESTEPQLADTLPPAPRSRCPQLKFFSTPHSSWGAGTTVDRACCGQSLSPGRHQGAHSPHCPTGQAGRSPFRRLHLGTNKNRDRQATRRPPWLHVCILQHLPESYQMFSLLLQLLPRDAGWGVTVPSLIQPEMCPPSNTGPTPERGERAQVSWAPLQTSSRRRGPTGARKPSTLGLVGLVQADR